MALKSCVMAVVETASFCARLPLLPLGLGLYPMNILRAMFLFVMSISSSTLSRAGQNVTLPSYDLLVNVYETLLLNDCLLSCDSSYYAATSASLASSSLSHEMLWFIGGMLRAAYLIKLRIVKDVSPPAMFLRVGDAFLMIY